MYKPDTYFGKHNLAVPTMVNTCQYNPIDGRISHKKKGMGGSEFSNPIGSMYGIFTNIYPINDPNVGKYTMDPMGITGPFETSELPQVETSRPHTLQESAASPGKTWQSKIPLDLCFLIFYCWI